MHSARQFHRIFFLCLLLSVALTAGTNLGSLAEPVRPMQKPNLKDQGLNSEQGYTALLFWRLQLEDRTGDCAAYYPRFVFGPMGSARRATSGNLVPMTPGEYLQTHYSTPALQGKWEKKGDGYIFQGLYAVLARPGQYELFQFKLNHKDAEFPSAVAVDLGERPFQVAKGQLLYLGDLNITVQSRERKPDGLFYRFLIKDGSDVQPACDRDFHTLKALLPGIVSAFPSGPTLVSPPKNPIQTSGSLKK